MIALLSTCLLVAVAFFLVTLSRTYKYAPRYPTGAFTHHAPVYEPGAGWWIEFPVVVSGFVVAALYVVIVLAAVSL